MTTSKPRILILGASGMLGNAALRYFSSTGRHEAFGTIRSPNNRKFFPDVPADQIIDSIDIDHHESVVELLNRIRPDAVLNCIGVIKQLGHAKDPLVVLPINSLLPHQLARTCAKVGARLIHISTDCVFSGKKGLYLESDFPDADDLYGRSKLLGEVDYPHAITLRTSIIGHELQGTNSLVDWFLSQEGSVKGFKKAVFSGLPAIEIARVVDEFVLPHPELHGLYHLSVDPINKYDLLKLVAEEYGKNIQIHPEDQFVIDRSLDSSRFRTATGFRPPAWPELVKKMKASRFLDRGAV